MDDPNGRSSDAKKDEAEELDAEKVKQAEEKPTEKSEIKGTNSVWDGATIAGDDDRKNKFLRLMGGKKEKAQPKSFLSKKLESRKVLPEKKYVYDYNKAGHIHENLEQGYVKSMEAAVTGRTRKHVGFGYKPPSPKREKVEEKKEEGAPPLPTDPPPVPPPPPPPPPADPNKSQ
ncbi:small acidic protein-like [Oscarella lobularis]|uniref:small acidic protein-like n=1 Tax=Oscarella lobularis TaxID=121494 RepID=UPI003314418F